jgi:hypothetical protein
MNRLFPISAIGHIMEVASIRVSLKDKFALGVLVPFEFLLLE